MSKYLATYKEMMKQNPIYFAVALLPCARLWVWLANTLIIPDTNVYHTWAEDNKYGKPEKHYKALLNKYLNTASKIKRANALFRKQMQNEYDFFATSWADHIVSFAGLSFFSFNWFVLYLNSKYKYVSIIAVKSLQNTHHLFTRIIFLWFR